jgi:hypothetical protein
MSAQTMAVEPPQQNRTLLYVGTAVAVAVLAIGGFFAMAKKQPSAPAPSATQPTQTQTATSEPQSEAPATQAPPETHASGAKGAVPKTNESAAQPLSEQPLTRREKRREKIREVIAAGNSAASQSASEPANAGVSAASSGMWTREDIPDLLRKADVYSGRGEYGRAIATYREILRIDGGNAAAREGLQKAKEAQQLRR